MKWKMGQQSHRSDPRILNRRTLRRDHRHLRKLLRPGMDILDVGCGTGAITADIAKAVDPDGMVLGIRGHVDWRRHMGQWLDSQKLFPLHADQTWTGV